MSLTSFRISAGSLCRTLSSSLRANSLFSSAKLVFARLYSFKKWRTTRNLPEIYLELGSGPKSGVGKWITLDTYGADICHDLATGLPFYSHSVDIIYASHLLEHFCYADLKLLLAECFRVLKVGGCLSVCVPDVERYIKSYLDGRNFRDSLTTYPGHYPYTGSAIDQINHIAYMDSQHRYMFDRENLLNMLKLFPFSQVSLRDFNAELDVSSRHFESIYALAIK